MKLVLDIIMLILFLLEINHNLIGQQFHEIAGVVLAVLVVVHLICNRRWFVSIVQNQNRDWKRGILVFVNLLLLFSFVGLMTSGVMISGYLLPNVTLGNQRVWSEIHHLLINAIEIDAVSGATPGTGKMIYEWDGTDDKGDKLSSGKYMFYVEGTLYWSSIVTLSGTVEFGGNDDSNIDVQTIYTADTKDNRDMIQNVSARYYIRETE